MPVWRTIPVDEEPQIVLRNWSVREIHDGDRHFVGYHDAGFEGRVSSKILEFDPAKGRGKTRSGRVYQLEGEPGYHADAEYVWGIWSAINQVKDANYKDVTQEILREDDSA